MCGIAGILGSGSDRDVAATARKMTDRLAHRGPDDSGVWVDAEAGIALGHRRLSILDLSPAGHQPMASPTGRYVISYNGEIYNHQELKAALEASGVDGWRGHSDTEVLIAAIEKWGIEGALKRANGMFAFAVWDRAERLLYLARDRLGEKPLYYGRQGGVFLFASELKAITAHPAFRREIDREALTLFLRHNYVPAPLSIWKGISKLPPAHYVVVAPDGSVGQPACYWSFDAVVREGVRTEAASGAHQDQADELERLLSDAVRCRMVADVPLGGFLSGGIDSSTIVAMMQAHSERPVKTFSIGFEEGGYDEAEHAKAVATHLGTDHTELYVTPADALAVIPRLPTLWDEPFSDSSQIPTYLLSALTRAHVTVCLSGDGGDELFGGYERYFRAHELWRRVSALPPALRSLFASVARSPWTSRTARAVDALLPGPKRALAQRLPMFASLLERDRAAMFYRHFVSHWKEPASLVIGGYESPGAFMAPEPSADIRETMMYLDTITYLPDDILTKVDRASMAVSLETRVPFLDHRVVELAWRLPIRSKVLRTTGKWILREVLWRYVPRHLVDRPKKGFAVPIDSWLAGPLREWAEDLLDERRLTEEGFFDPAPIRAKWEEHLLGRGQWHYYLWDILMFEEWWRQQCA